MLAGVLVIVALVLACTATALVATAAWPVHEIEDGQSTDDRRESRPLHDTARRLRLGIAITFIAVVLLAVGATTSWWPEEGSSSGGHGQVEVTTNQGGRLPVSCGTEIPAPSRSRAPGRRSSSRPATSCGCAAVDSCVLTRGATAPP